MSLCRDTFSQDSTNTNAKIFSFYFIRVIFKNMGGVSTQSYDEVRNFNTTITQASTQSCEISCTNKFNGNTVILIGLEGNFTVIQRCKIENSNCQLKAAFTANIVNLIETSVQQSAEAMGGLSFTFNSQNQAIDISSTVANSISQIMASTCKISVAGEINNNYIVSIGQKGNILFDQDQGIKSTNCIMDISGKASAFNKSVSDASQSAKVQSVFTLLLIAFVVLVVVIGAVLITFIRSSGKVLEKTAGLGGIIGGGSK